MPEDAITLTYDPFTLPTSQHRAGLAGLMVLTESMRRRSARFLPTIKALPDARYCVTLTQRSLTTLFNDLYDVALEERPSDKKQTKKRPKRTVRRKDKATGKEKISFIYDHLVPKAHFLKAFGMPDIWIKLWRDAVWETLRDRDRKRIPYQERKRKKHVGEAAKLWKAFQAFDRSRQSGRLHGEDIASSIFIGAQAVNAERIPFRGRVDENLLLHFWPVVMGVYQPETINRKGERKFQGYVIAIPDVMDFEGFCHDFPAAMDKLRPQAAGYRPRDAVISVPQEGGLEYMHHLLGLAKAKSEGQEIALYDVTGVEVYHLEKRGNNVHMLAAERIAIDQRILEDYEAIRGRYFDPIYRRQRILNLLRRDPWYSGFAEVFASNRYEFFVGSKAARFQGDVRKQFAAEFQSTNAKGVNV
jgi:CRISPR-associated protein Cmx8